MRRKSWTALVAALTLLSEGDHVAGHLELFSLARID